MNLASILTEDNFTAWLKTFNSDEVVGKSCSFRDCPIYHFLNSKNVPVNSVLAGNINLRNGVKAIKNPHWVENFITVLDLEQDDHTYEVMAEKALEILQKS